MSASSTIRTVTELRLVELLGGLPGWSTSPDTPGIWWVRPWGRGQPESRRQVTVGVPTGSIDPEAIASLSSSTTDAWTCTIWIICTDIIDGPTAKQTIEDRVNEVADLLVSDQRLGINPGPRSALIGSWEGPYFELIEGDAIATAEIEITFTADIWRNPT